MRPRGVVHLATLGVAGEIARERAGQPIAGATWRDAAERLRAKGVARDAVRHTWKNLVALGHLERVGEVRAVDSARPLVAYRPAPGTGQRSAAGAELFSVAQAWVTGSR